MGASTSPSCASRGAERLLPFLEKIGRARLVRDRRMTEALRRNLPAVFEEDFEWIRGRLSGELIAAYTVDNVVRHEYLLTRATKA